ncbi:MAG TPA: NifU family protein [Longimicrobiales bacterium]
MPDRRTQILEVLEGIRPALHADGGDVEFIDFDEESGRVIVRWMGVCGSCPISTVTLKQGIEKRLMSAVPGVTEVAAIS